MRERIDSGKAPRLASWLLARLVADPMREDVQRCLAELYRRRRRTHGRLRSRLWYWRQVGGFALRARAVRRATTLTQAQHTRVAPGLRGWRRLVRAVTDDGRQAIRSLAYRPALTASVVAILALGIAANATVFSVVDPALFRPLPYPDAGRLVAVRLHSVRTGIDPSPRHADFLRWHARDNGSVDALVAYQARWKLLEGVDTTDDEVVAQAVSAGFLDLLGAQLQIGRGFVADDYRPGAQRVAILDHGFWQRIGGGRDVLGRTLDLNGTPHTVVGVLAPGFRFSSIPVQLFTALVPPAPGAEARSEFVEILARLHAGATMQQLAAELRASSDVPALADSSTDALVPTVEPLRDTLYGWAWTRFGPFLGVMAFVLLLVAANVANLMLVAATNRRKELAIKAALGAGGSRLARQIATEVLIVTAGSAGAGTLMTYWGIRALVRTNPLNAAHVNPRLDARVAVFGLIVALLAGSLAALGPVLSTLRIRLQSALSGSRRTAATGRPRLLQRALIVVQISSSILLLTGAGLLTKTTLRMSRYDPGVATRNLLSFYLGFREGRDGAESGGAVARPLLERVEAVPGILSAAYRSPGGSFAEDLDLGRGGVTLDGETEPLPAAALTDRGSYGYVSDGYFETLGVRLLRGRTFAGLGATDEPIAIVNEEAARRWWPGAGTDVVGKRFKLGPPASPNPWLTVVGVVATTGSLTVQAVGWDPAARVYLQSRPGPAEELYYYARTAGKPLTFVDALRAAAAEVGADVSIRNPEDVGLMLQEEVAYFGVSAKILLGFALFGLALALMGTYGTVAYGVARRTHEIGVRKALGARSRHVLQAVAKDSLLVGVLGILAGLGLATILTRVLTSMLYGTSPIDPTVFGASTGILLVTVAVAAYLPARRAVRLDPRTALHAE